MIQTPHTDSIILDRQDPAFRSLDKPTLLAVTFVEQSALSVDAPGEAPSPQDFFRWAKLTVTSIEPAPVLPEGQCAAYIVRLADGGTVISALHHEDGQHVWRVAAAYVSASGTTYAPLDPEHHSWAIIASQPLAPRWIRLFLKLVKRHVK